MSTAALRPAERRVRLASSRRASIGRRPARRARRVQVDRHRERRSTKHRERGRLARRRLDRRGRRLAAPEKVSMHGGKTPAAGGQAALEPAIGRESGEVYPRVCGKFVEFLQTCEQSVYPRVCGGAVQGNTKFSYLPRGRCYPRVCGEHSCGVYGRMPSSSRVSAGGEQSVYPRVCGEAQIRNRFVFARRTMLSPRVRGSLFVPRIPFRQGGVYRSRQRIIPSRLRSEGSHPRRVSAWVQAAPSLLKVTHRPGKKPG